MHEARLRRRSADADRLLAKWALHLIVNAFLQEHARDPFERLAVDIKYMHTMVATLAREQLHRIYSMTARSDNDHLLWTAYAAGHSGYCLEFDNRGWPFAIAGIVRYGDEVEVDVSRPTEIDAAFLFRKTHRYAEGEEIFT